MLNFPKTPSQFKRQAEAGFRRANPDAEDVSFVWTYGPKRVTFPTGLRGFSGVADVEARGFKSKSVVATATPETGLSVR